jgi:hypothetical protein
VFVIGCVSCNTFSHFRQKASVVADALEGASRGRLGGLSAPPPFERRACASPRLVNLKAALLAETRARGPDGSRMRSPQLARRSRDQLSRSVDGWASMALRSDVWSRRRV